MCLKETQSRKQDRHDRERHQCEFGIQQEHQYRRACDHEHARDHRHQAIGNEIIDRVHIGCDSGDQATNRVAIKIREWQSLQLGEQIGPHIKQDVLTHPGQQVIEGVPRCKLENGNDRNRDADQDDAVPTFVQTEFGKTRARNGFEVIVDHLRLQNRVHAVRDRSDQREQQCGNHGPEVRAQVFENPLCYLPVELFGESVFVTHGNLEGKAEERLKIKVKPGFAWGHRVTHVRRDACFAQIEASVIPVVFVGQSLVVVLSKRGQSPIVFLELRRSFP